jgi:L-amino acid N-acyltransferase YncA
MAHATIRVRRAHPAQDAAACAAIYAPFVADTPVSFEERPPGEEEMRERIEGLAQRYPWLVAEEAGAVVGFAYASPHRERAAYRWAVDVTVYVAEGSRGRGVGRALYERLLELLAHQGFAVACAGITLPNAASVALHEACGFERVGVYPGIGWKAGAWRDVGWWHKRLLPMTPERPPEPRAG